LPQNALANRIVCAKLIFSSSWHFSQNLFTVIKDDPKIINQVTFGKGLLGLSNTLL